MIRAAWGIRSFAMLGQLVACLDIGRQADTPSKNAVGSLAHFMPPPRTHNTLELLQARPSTGNALSYGFENRHHTEPAIGDTTSSIPEREPRITVIMALQQSEQSHRVTNHPFRTVQHASQ